MIAVWFALSSLFLAAIGNVIIERKLAHISPLVFMLLTDFGLTILVFCIIMFCRVSGAHFIGPQGNEYWFLAAWIVVSFFSGFFFLSAYHKGASLMMMTTMVMLLPVFAALIKIGIGGSTPSLREIVAWVFATIAVLLASRP